MKTGIVYNIAAIANSQISGLPMQFKGFRRLWMSPFRSLISPNEG